MGTTAKDILWVTQDLQNSIFAILLPFYIWGLYPHSGRIDTNCTFFKGPSPFIT